MNVIKLSITAILAALSTAPSPAHPSDFDPVLPATSYTLAQFMTPVVYKNSMVNSPAQARAATDQAPDTGGSLKALWDTARVRTNALSMEISRADVATSNDHVSLSIYAPMEAVNAALSLAGYATRSRLDNSSITRAQILSLMARRQVNAEFMYSIKMNRYSKFDSFITYRVNTDPDPTKNGLSAGLRYNIRF